MSEKGYNKVSLANMDNGAVIELFDAELPGIYENLLNPAMDPKKSRSITLEVKFWIEPQNPKLILYSYHASKKLVKPGSSGAFEIGMDEGEVTGYESEGIQNPLPNVNGAIGVVSLRSAGKQS